MRLTTNQSLSTQPDMTLIGLLTLLVVPIVIANEWDRIQVDDRLEKARDQTQTLLRML